MQSALVGGALLASPNTFARAGRLRAMVLGASAAGVAAAAVLEDGGWIVQVIEPGQLVAEELFVFGAERMHASLQSTGSGSVDFRLAMEPTLLEHDGATIRVLTRAGHQFAADAAVIALPPDALRSIRIFPSELAASLQGHSGRPRHALRVTARIYRRDGQRETRTLVLGDAEAHWLDTLAGEELRLHVRHRVAVAVRIPVEAVTLLSVDSFRRRRWPVDIGWIGGEALSRRVERTATLSKARISVCGLHTTDQPGVTGLIRSGQDAAMQLLAF